jgi:hypothetical protein
MLLPILPWIEFAAAFAAAGYFGWLCVRAISTGRIRLPLGDRKNYYSRRSRPMDFLVVFSWYAAFTIAAVIVMFRIKF